MGCHHPIRSDLRCRQQAGSAPISMAGNRFRYGLWRAHWHRRQHPWWGYGQVRITHRPHCSGRWGALQHQIGTGVELGGREVHPGHRPHQRGHQPPAVPVHLVAHWRSGRQQLRCAGMRCQRALHHRLNHCGHPMMRHGRRFHAGPGRRACMRHRIRRFDGVPEGSRLITQRRVLLACSLPGVPPSHKCRTHLSYRDRSQ